MNHSSSTERRISLSRIVVLAAALLLVTVASASAQGANTPLTGTQWQAIPFVDNAPLMNQGTTQFICFRANGTYFGVNGFGGQAWSGRWDQKGGNAAGNGNEIRLRGNFSAGLGNEGASGHFVALNIISMKWEQFTDGPANGQNFGFPFQVVLVATGLPCPAGPIQAPVGRALAEPEPVDEKDVPFRIENGDGDIVPIVGELEPTS